MCPDLRILWEGWLPATARHVDLDGDTIEDQIHVHRITLITFPRSDLSTSRARLNRSSALWADVDVGDFGGVEHRHLNPCLQALQRRGERGSIVG